ncbi:hypothetical protein C8R46DRAFT_904706, partial [Mycena filopes]
LDAALAMQLRPGLGLGADGAWLVRFLMSFFGWLGCLLLGMRTGRGRGRGGGAGCNRATGMCFAVR